MEAVHFVEVLGLDKIQLCILLLLLLSLVLTILIGIILAKMNK